MDSVKTVADQVREIDKIVSDGMDKLEQAKFALRSLQDRLATEGSEQSRSRTADG
ncbi:MAG TPA: hypothetical protein VGF91_26315 [Solirubrobacteraceae bacterium]